MYSFVTVIKAIVSGHGSIRNSSVRDQGLTFSSFRFQSEVHSFRLGRGPEKLIPKKPEFLNEAKQ